MISGYAAVFYDGTERTQYHLGENVFERMAPHAFDGAIRNDDVVALFNHNPDNVLGRSSAGTLRLSIDSVGLRYEIDNPGTSVAKDVAAMQARNEITGSSFAFRAVDEDFRREDGVIIREVRDVRLFDVGPVTYPAYAGTSDGRSVRHTGADKRAMASYDAEMRSHCEASIWKIRTKMELAKWL